MSVLAEAISVIVQRDVIVRKYPGGLAGYERDCPNRTYCADDHLTRVGFMTPTDVEAFVARLASLGFVHLSQGASIDLCVVDQHRGPTAACAWLEGGKHPDGYSAVWRTGTIPGTMHSPTGWRPVQSGELNFVPSERVDERLLGLAREDGIETHLDFETGKQVFVGRATVTPRTTEHAEQPPAAAAPAAIRGLSSLKSELRAQLLASYKHRESDGTACAICGAKNRALAFQILEKAVDVGDPVSGAFVPLSRSRGVVRGSFPVCTDCAPPCNRCGLPRLTDRVLEYRRAIEAAQGLGVCQHVQWRTLAVALWRRLVRSGRFAGRS